MTDIDALVAKSEKSNHLNFACTENEIVIRDHITSLTQFLQAERKARLEAEAAGMERAARILEAMVVVGRAWNDEQKKAAEILYAGAAAIRKEIVR